MVELHIFLAFIAAAFVAGAFLWSKLSLSQRELSIIKHQHKTLSTRNNDLMEDVKLARNELLDSNNGKVAAETKMIEQNRTILKHEDQIKLLSRERDTARSQSHENEKQLVAMKKELSAAKEAMQDWDKAKEQYMEAAKASILDAGTKLSNKLLDDHKREFETAKKENDVAMSQTKDKLQQQFQKVCESVSTLHSQVQESKKTVNLVERSLLNPSGAGSLAEISLENIFKASSLQEGMDYKIQHWIKNSEGSGLKPDAVVFLPGDGAMVIDSKASKFFVEINDAANDEAKSILEEKLKSTMNDHLKDLIKRDYRKAMEEQINLLNGGTEVGHVDILMFLPTDESLATLRRIDPLFTQKAWRNRILPVGPSTLLSLLLQANLLISSVKREQNSRQIATEVAALLGSIARLQELAENVGKSLKSNCKKYDAFAASFNRNFLSKAKTMEKLGVSANKSGNLTHLERFQLVSSTFDTEAEEIESETQEDSSLEDNSDGAPNEFLAIS